MLMIAGVCAARCLPGYVDPVMIGEDWSILFEGHLWDRDLGRIVQPYAGYVSVGPQLVGWLVSFLPAAARGYALAWVAGLVAVVSLAWFASERFARLLPDHRTRASVAVLLAILPLADAGLLCATMYAHWHLLFVLCLMPVAAAPATGRGRAGEIFVAVLCAWSHPLALVTAPLFGWRAWRESATARRHYLALAAVVLAYPSFGIDWGVNVGVAPGILGAFGALWSTVILPSLLYNYDLNYWLASHGVPAALAFAPMALLAFSCWRARGRHSVPPALTALLAAAVLVSMGTVASRWGSQQRLLFACPRYGYVPALLVALATVVTVLRLVPARAGLVGAVLVLHALALNTRATRLRYAVRPPSNGRVVAFAAEVAAWARRSGPPGEVRRLALPGRAIEVVRPGLAAPAPTGR